MAGFPFRLEVRCDGASVTLLSQTAAQAVERVVSPTDSRRVVQQARGEVVAQDDGEQVVGEAGRIGVLAELSVGVVVDLRPVSRRMRFGRGFSRSASLLLGWAAVAQSPPTEAALAAYERSLARLGLDPGQIKYLVLTHGHNDHINAAAAVAAEAALVAAAGVAVALAP